MNLFCVTKHFVCTIPYLHAHNRNRPSPKQYLIAHLTRPPRTLTQPCLVRIKRLEPQRQPRRCATYALCGASSSEGALAVSSRKAGAAFARRKADALVA